MPDEIRQSNVQRWLGLCFILMALAACGPLIPTSALGCSSSPDVPWRQVAPSIWVWAPAAESDPHADNGGHVQPISVLVDGNHAMVIDPGPSHRYGERVRQSLKCRFNARVTWVINTHAHAENVLGNSAFAQSDGDEPVRFGASRPTMAAMQRRCPACLHELTQKLGPAAMEDTRIVLPDTPLERGMWLMVGQRPLLVWDVVDGHTEGDLLLWDPSTRVLWVGGLVYGQRVPELAQGRLDAWLDVLARLQDWEPAAVVGSTVSVATDRRAPPAALQSTYAYLSDLRQSVWRAMETGVNAHEAEQIRMPAYAGWDGYAERQGFNLQRAWRELEPLWMRQGTSAD